MRSALWRLFIFALVFTIEVRVKAAERVSLVNVAQPVQQPEDCVGKQTLCAVRTGNEEKYRLIVGAATVTLDASSVVIRTSDRDVTLVSGTVWIKSEEPFSVHTEYGQASSQSGEFWVSRDAERMSVSATDRPLTLTPRGSSQGIRLELGEENWLGPVDRRGVATSGIPRAIYPAAHLSRWARLYPGTKKGFEKEVKVFFERWAVAAEEVATYHHELAERRMASLEAAAEREARSKAEVERRTRELKALFRRKTLLD